MTLCPECQCWLAQCLKQAILDLEAGEHQAGSDKVFKFNVDRESETLFNSRLSCPICARFWIWLRVLSEPLDRLMTDEEVLQDQSRQFGRVSISLERRYSPGALAERGGSRLHFNINSSGRGPVFQLADESRSKPRSPSRTRSHKLRYRDMIYSENPTVGPIIHEKRHRYTPLVIKKQQRRMNSDKSIGPQIIEGSRMTMVQRWLKNCVTNHPACKEKWEKRKAGGSFLPTRLINVGDHDREVKLIYSMSFANWRHINYATLSHCWGDEPFTTLKKANHNDFIHHIQVENLGKTFQEALLLCRALKIRYLWIDSFCIIQDSDKGRDWRREAPKMHEIYGNSYLNLAASASTACCEGLHRHFTDVLSEPIKIELPDGRKVMESPEADSSTLLILHWLQSPLHTRGWVAQELFLSQRILHFTDIQMYWECVEGIKSESGVGTELGPAWRFHGLSKSQVDLDQLWLRVASHYSGTKVTFASDKMMALAGLAANTAKSYGELGVDTTYAAGCWRHNLIQWLLWAPTFLMQAKVAKMYLPSWSWLALGHKIYFDESLQNFSLPIQEMIQVKDLHIIMEDPDIPFGQVKTSQIYARSSIFKVVVQVNDILKHKGEERSALDSCRVVSVSEMAVAEIVSVPFSASRVSVWIDSSTRPLANIVKFECLYAAKQVFPTGVSYFGLLVQPISGSSNNVPTYERCGLFKLWVDAIQDNVQENAAAKIIYNSESEQVDFILV